MKAKTYNRFFDQEPKYLNIYYDTEKFKLICLKEDSKFHNGNDNLNMVFTLTPYFIAIIQSLKIPFSKAKNIIIKTINIDIAEGNMFTENSNLYKLLVDEFGINLRTYNKFISR